MKRFTLDKSFIRNYFIFALIMVGSATGIFLVMWFNTQEFNNLFNDIVSAFNQENYLNAKQHLTTLKINRERYSVLLLVLLAVSTLLVLILNAVLLSTQRQRGLAEASFKHSEERFALAVAGTQDGIFDWDVETKEAFFSKQYFNMLGYDRPTTGKVHDFLELIHPEDREKVWAYKESYINGDIPEYEQDYRMLHATNRWVWIKARATGVFDPKTGKAIRLVGAHTDITASKNLEERLTQEIEVAEESNRAKSEFLAHMSHEIRTPLTAISGAIELLDMQKETLNEKQSKLVKVLMTSSTALKELINSILDFSKIESSGIELDEHPFALDQLLQETLEMMSIRAEAQGLELGMKDAPIKGLQYFGDSTRIRQILVNIIGNAAKFTEKGSVHVAVTKRKVEDFNQIKITVKDTGIGIARDKLESIFEPFKQGDSSIIRKHGGTGLGLPTARKLARIMGGDVSVTSTKGRGSTFTITLLLKDANDVSILEEKHDNKLVDERIRERITPKTRILIAEDYEGNAEVLGQLLESLGLEYDAAEDGEQAVKLWSTNQYDLVLMDVQMPYVDGFTATQRIRDKEAELGKKRTPIVGMTAHALVGDRQKCIAVGMDAYLPKPLDDTELKRLILRYLRRTALAQKTA